MSVTNQEQPAESFTTIHRFAMPLDAASYKSEGTTFEIEMPAGSSIISVERLSVYAMVDTGAPMKTRRLFMISTGHKIARPEMLRHLVSGEGRHLFEVVELPH